MEGSAQNVIATLRKLGLYATNLGSLTAVDLTNRGVSASDVMALKEMLRTSTALRSLKLGYNSLRDEGAYAVAAALENQASLLALDLGFNDISDKGAGALGRSLGANCTLRTLYLSGNLIGPYGASSLASGLSRNSTLDILYLTGNSLGPDGASMLSKALHVNNSLKKIYMSGSSIGPTGAEALASALLSPTATASNETEYPHLRLKCCDLATEATTDQIRSQDADLDAQILTEKTDTVGVTPSRIAEDASDGLDCIYISDNDILDQGMVAIATAMQENRYLKILELGYV